MPIEVFERWIMMILLSLLTCASPVKKESPDPKSLGVYISRSDPLKETYVGTATRIKWKEKYYWITASHVCLPSSKNIYPGSKLEARIFEYSGPEHSIEVLYADLDFDICVASSEPGPSFEISDRNSEIGGRVSYMGYPTGFYEVEYVSRFDGYFSGYLEKDCGWSLHATGGASGSLVFDESGRVVGMITKVLTDFNGVSLGPCRETLVDFLNKVDAIQDKIR